MNPINHLKVDIVGLDKLKRGQRSHRCRTGKVLGTFFAMSGK